MNEKLAAEIVKKSGIMHDTGMTPTTPKPRAGEHVIRCTPETDEASDHCRTCGLDFADLDVSRRLEVERNDLLKASQAVPVDAGTFRRTNELRLKAEAERDVLRERERELVEALRALTDLCDNVPIFQLDDGKASVKAVRLAGKFTAAHKAAHTLLAKEKTA